MKFLCILCVFLISGCTIDVRPIQKKRHYYRSSSHHKSHSTKSKSSTQKMVTVDAEWIETYRRAEKDVGYSIPADERIKAVGDKFLVPQVVIDHYEDLTNAPPPPKPTPEPYHNPLWQ
jgi:hypothetical protein